MLEGFSKVLEVLADKVSRKAAIVALSMILVYMLAPISNLGVLSITDNAPITDNVPNENDAPSAYNIKLFTFSIVGLAVFFTTLQWILDFMYGRKSNKAEFKKEKVKNTT